MAAGSIPNRAQDPNRKVSYEVKPAKTPIGKAIQNRKILKSSYEALRKPEYNPIGKTDLNIVRSGASGAFKKMGFKTPIERAQERNRRPGKPPLPGF